MAAARPKYNTASRNRYTSAHENSTGPGDARPTALQIVEYEGLIGKLSDKVFVVTGVSSGIGVETMRALYATGGRVFGTARNLAKGQKAVDEIKSTTKGGEITLIEIDQDSLASVRKGAEEILKQTETINVLVNNAGFEHSPDFKQRSSS